MRLYIMRHGPAEEGAPSGRDFDRQLTAEGRKRVTAAAELLRRRGEVPDHILSSPLVRAVQTAALVAAVFGIDIERTDIRQSLAPAEDAHGLVQELLVSSWKSVLLVSHAPDVSLLAERLVGRRSRDFSPATIAALELTKHSATNLFLLDAAALAL